MLAKIQNMRRGNGVRRGGGRGGGERLSTDDFQRAVERAAPLLSSPNRGEDPPFDDALHAVLTFARPTSEDECVQFIIAVGKLIRVAGDDEDHWKMLVLALIRRRYHARAPEARAAEEDESDGDGERLLFYLATRAMQAAAQEGQPVASARAATAASAAEAACRYLAAASAADLLEPPLPAFGLAGATSERD